MRLWRSTATDCAAKDGGKRSRDTASLVHLVYQITLLLGLLAGSYLFCSRYVVQSVQVSGTSMSPTLHDADRCLVKRFSTLLQPPQRGDIVVLQDPTDDSFAVKRIIGLSGETIQLRDGAVFVNGRRLKESYLPRGVRTFPYSKPTQVVQCGPDQFFVLGDNRLQSLDSRSYGPVSRGAILGLIGR